MTRESWIIDQLDQLEAGGLLRRQRITPGVGGKFLRDGVEMLNFSSNDYLNLAGSSELVEGVCSAVRDWGAGSGSSRLVSGSLPCHEELESRLAGFKGYPASLVFGSGYMTNLGCITALVSRDDEVFVDRLAHASMIDGALMSRARLQRFAHNNVEHLQKLLARSRTTGRKLVMTESVFSMDGDIAPVRQIAELAGQHGAMLLIDEAHSTGVFGPFGKGIVSEMHLQNEVNLAMGTLSKAVGAFGGFVACSKEMREFLFNRARSFIFSTGVPPAVAGAVCAALDMLEKLPEPGRDIQARAELLRHGFRDMGLDTGASASQIIPVIVGDNDRALALASALEQENILAVAIRPPTVPPGTARLRFSVTAAHTDDDIVRTLDVVESAARQLDII